MVVSLGSREEIHLTSEELSRALDDDLEIRAGIDTEIQEDRVAYYPLDFFTLQICLDHSDQVASIFAVEQGLSPFLEVLYSEASQLFDQNLVDERADTALSWDCCLRGV